MKKITTLLAIACTALLIQSCGTSAEIKGPKVVLPHFAIVDDLSKLKEGMTKQDVLRTLNGVYPYDILNGTILNCEVHEYKYYKQERNIGSDDATTKNALTSGPDRYVKPNIVHVVYKEGKLYSVLTGGSKKDLAKLMVELNDISKTCANNNGGIIYGCMDPMSLNYNPNATVDNKDCKYCDCGTIRNPKYNPNLPISECNQPCIKEPSKQDSKEEKTEEECTYCDLFKAIGTNSNTNVNINISPEGLSTKKTKTKK
jgi:hypothetical protein